MAGVTGTVLGITGVAGAGGVGAEDVGAEDVGAGGVAATGVTGAGVVKADCDRLSVGIALTLLSGSDGSGEADFAEQPLGGDMRLSSVQVWRRGVWHRGSVSACIGAPGQDGCKLAH
jgi:hypothetical protein